MNETSARPRPSSSATMAASTPEASGAPPSSGTRSSRQPAGPDRGVQLLRPLAVTQLADGTGTQAVDHLDGGIAERLLLRREAHVHQGSPGVAANTGVHSSRNVRRSTLPEGSLGTASTTTT